MTDPPVYSGKRRLTSLDEGELPVVKPKVVAMPDFGVVVFESRHAPGFVPSVLEQDFSEFLLVISGHAQLRGNSKIFGLGPNSLVHIPARTKYFYTDVPSKPVTLYAIQYRTEIMPAKINQHLASLGILHWNLSGAALPLAQPIRSACQEMLFEQDGKRAGWETALYARLLDLTVRALRMCSPHAETDKLVFAKGKDSAERVANYAVRLKSQFFHHQTLDHAARAAGVSRRQFTALFRNITGLSWHKYVLQLRLRHAQKLLLDSDKPVAAVAFECGFDDLSHFNHVFKQATGCAPSIYRERQKG